MLPRRAMTKCPCFLDLTFPTYLYLIFQLSFHGHDNIDIICNASYIGESCHCKYVKYTLSLDMLPLVHLSIQCVWSRYILVIHDMCITSVKDLIKCNAFPWSSCRRSHCILNSTFKFNFDAFRDTHFFHDLRNLVLCDTFSVAGNVSAILFVLSSCYV